MIVGILECEPGDVNGEDVVYYAVEMVEKGGFKLIGVMWSSLQDISYRNDVDLTGATLSADWNMPLNPNCAMVFYREAELPKSQISGQVVMAFAGWLFTDPKNHGHLMPENIVALDGDEEVLGYSGRLGSDVRPDWIVPNMVDSLRGKTLAEYLKQPLWGFGEKQEAVSCTVYKGPPRFSFG